jgi:ankyrin repeat protein
LLPELELIIGCIVALSRMLWQLKDSDVDASLSLFDTMLGVCAPATPPRLHAAARSNLANVVAMLLDAGADPHQREPSTALHWACRQSGGQRCAQLLLDAGCDVNAASQQHMTPLMRVGSPRTAELLLERGALVDAIDVDGWTPMFWCVLEGDQRETIRADGEPRSRAVESHTRLRGPEESAEAPRNARDVRRIEHAQTREDAEPHALNCRALPERERARVRGRAVTSGGESAAQIAELSARRTRRGRRRERRRHGRRTRCAARLSFARRTAGGVELGRVARTSANKR